MDAVTPQISSQRFARTVNGTGNNTVYAFGDCMNDLSQIDCDQCFAQCKTQIPRCLPFQRATRGGRIYYDGCYLRYDDYNFFGEALNPGDRTVCGKKDFGGNLTVFRENTIELVRNLSVEAQKNNGFFVGSVNRGDTTVYGLVQCWEFVNGSSCRRCLENATAMISSCLPKEEGRVLNAGCYLRYSPEKFYQNSTSAASGGGGGSRHLAVILAVISSVLAVLMIVAAGVFFGKRKLAKRRRERKQLGALAATVHRSELNFKYETLERATNYFNNNNKLGQGGSGSVFKGTLPDGKIVAVKRLFFNTRQWVDQFFNEVNLISDIHHKNLVKLLGCSITGPESLLVYEYVPNKSLQDHLFDPIRGRTLNWEKRFDIIIGTSEGLVYLHENSKIRIIHRDIKSSNILLDSKLRAKIADFGLARSFEEDKSHISTAIAGTLGYMAPEYLAHGQLTEKADVYSFGVLLIEIVTGKQNTRGKTTDYSDSLVTSVWKHFQMGRVDELFDQNLTLHNYDNNINIKEEILRVVQIGLLCTQEVPSLRPSMSTVLHMLSQKNEQLPLPANPPFMDEKTMELNDTREDPRYPFNANSIYSNATASDGSFCPR
ncbi:Protein kinase domain [Macleaya cordata]|uniref:Protein kinase domain n=1 Tax=Macleaya cordata TaxID=56857 RepID=A0A200RAW1_MACCD|nr:Protein kinase domain [Macleaya cordata]